LPTESQLRDIAAKLGVDADQFIKDLMGSVPFEEEKKEKEVIVFDDSLEVPFHKLLRPGPFAPNWSFRDEYGRLIKSFPTKNEALGCLMDRTWSHHLGGDIVHKIFIEADPENPYDTVGGTYEQIEVLKHHASLDTSKHEDPETEETITVTDHIPSDVLEFADEDALHQWELANAVIPHSRRVLFYGPPSTGKTYFANTVGGVTKDDIYSVTLTEETSAAEIRGHFINRGSDTVWHYGPGARAWLEGKRFVINEIDRASADALTLLYALLDDPMFASLTLPNGETIRPEEGFAVVATMNGVPEDLPEALQSRFPVKFGVNKPNPAAIAALDKDLRKLASGLSIRRDENRQDLRAFFEFQSLRKFVSVDLAGEAVFADQWPSIKATLTLGS